MRRTPSSEHCSLKASVESRPGQKGMGWDYSEIRKQNETMDKNLVRTLSWEEKGLSCRRGVETMMEEAGFFFLCLSISSQLLLLFAYI